MHLLEHVRKIERIQFTLITGEAVCLSNGINVLNERIEVALILEIKFLCLSWKQKIRSAKINNRSPESM